MRSLASSGLGIALLWGRSAASLAGSLCTNRVRSESSVAQGAMTLRGFQHDIDGSGDLVPLEVEGDLKGDIRANLAFQDDCKSACLIDQQRTGVRLAFEPGDRSVPGFQHMNRCSVRCCCIQPR